MNRNKLSIIPIFLFLSAFLASPAYPLNANHVMGEATEGVMKDYFAAGGWKPLEGQTGKQGIDGLFVKYDKSGNIKDVLIVESKYNTSQLGKNLKCGERQMSQDWVNCKLDALIQKAEKDNDPAARKKYSQLKTHVKKGNYRALAWRAKIIDGKLRIHAEKIKSKGGDVQSEKLFGGEKHKFQYKNNQEIDLKNPKNAYQRKMVNNFYANLDKSLEAQGLSPAERKKIINDFKANPDMDRLRSNIDSAQAKKAKAARSRRSSSRHPSVSRPPVRYASGRGVRSTTAKAASHINKRVAKSFSKRLLRSLGKGVKGAATGAFAGPWGAAIGFCAGVAGGMAMDYAIDSVVNEAFAGDSPPPEAGLSKTEFRRELEQSAAAVRQDIAAVEQRMEKEFTILGDDMQNYHEAEMAAIQNNLRETLKVGQAVEKVDKNVDQLRSEVNQHHQEEMAAIQSNIRETKKVGQAVEKVDKNVDQLRIEVQQFNENLIQGFATLDAQLTQISATLDAISSKLDAIYGMLDARIKADFDSGVESAELFETTGNQAHLIKSIEYFRTFKNTLLRIDGRSPEEDYLLGLSWHFMAAGYADLFQATQNKGYAVSAVNAFHSMTALCSDNEDTFDLLAITYLGVREADLNNEAARTLMDLHLPKIRQNLKSGHLDQAKAQAEGLHFWVDNDESGKIRDAVNKLIHSGHDNSGLFDDMAPDYQAIRAYVNNGQIPQGTPDVPPFLVNIAYGRPAPEDFNVFLEKYQSAELARFAARKLLNSNYHQAALDIIAAHPVKDDDFRAKAYLYIYDTLNASKADKLKRLILDDPTYSDSVKAFAEKI